MSAVKFYIPGEAQLAIIRAAVDDGKFVCQPGSQTTAATKANGHGYLDRDKKDGKIWYPTEKASEMLAFLAERDVAKAAADPEAAVTVIDIAAPFLPVPAHPLAELFPMMDAEDVARLADDIVTYGQRQKIVLLDGLVLDGRNRQAACLMADLVPEYEDYTGDDPLGFVWSLNVERRHLTTSQKAMACAKLCDWEVGINQHTGRANLPAREAGRRFSISERAVKAARRIKEHGVAELVAAVQAGKISVNTGEGISRMQIGAQAEVLRMEKKQAIAVAKAFRDEDRAASRVNRLGIISAIAERGSRKTGTMPRAAYPILYADPPWQQEAWNDVTGQDKGLMYPAMPLDDIKALCEGDRSPATRDAKLYLWVPANRLDDGVDVLRRWGFDYVSCVVWDKVHIGMGREVRDRTEFLLIGKRGEFPGEIPGTQMHSLHAEPKGAHSAKPVWFAEQIERLYPGVPKLELFCRSPRPGWDVWGFEADGGGEAVNKSENEVAA